MLLFVERVPCICKETSTHSLRPLKVGCLPPYGGKVTCTGRNCVPFATASSTRTGAKLCASDDAWVRDVGLVYKSLCPPPPPLLCPSPPSVADSVGYFSRFLTCPFLPPATNKMMYVTSIISLTPAHR
jgi:hypothetical protein